MNDPSLRRKALILWLLLAAFCLRVVGQMVVATGHVSFLPPMEEWFSGVISYPWLLLSQIFIILVYGKVCLDFKRGAGFFVMPHRALGSFLIRFGSVYFLVMVIRYIIRMSLYPHERWTGGSIPIFFHWVLASFLLVLGHYHRSRSRAEISRHWIIQFKRWAIGTVVSFAVALWVVYLLGPWVLGRTLNVRSSEYAVRAEKSAAFITSDGIRLVADIYHPRRAKQAPTILVRIPLPSDWTSRLFADLVGRFWAERGYTAVIQGTRGCFKSGGKYEPFHSERQDGLETLAWLSRQPWFDGRLGMWGGSYFGYTQWVLADQKNPGPSALMIYLASTDFYGMFHSGGTFSLASALFWAVRSQIGETPAPETLQRGFQGFPLVAADKRALQSIPYFKDWVLHSKRDAFWRGIDGHERPNNLRSPVLLMAGWYDPFLPTQLQDFIEIRQHAPLEIASASRLIIGPWTHAQTMTLPGNVKTMNFRLASLEPSIPWFDQHLLGSKTPHDQTAPIRIYVMGENIWREENEWPLARTRYTAYYLRSNGKANGVLGDGRLELMTPSLDDPPDVYTYDPLNPVPTLGGAMISHESRVLPQNSVEGRADVLVYSTPTLAEDVEVTGPVSLILYVMTSAPCTDFTGKLVDVYSDGNAYLISDGILRHCYADLEAKNPSEIRIDLWPTSNVFKKGHRIRLEVSSSNYPRFDRHPNTGRDISTETQPQPATQRIFHNQMAPSHLILPIIPRK